MHIYLYLFTYSMHITVQYIHTYIHTYIYIHTFMYIHTFIYIHTSHTFMVMYVHDMHTMHTMSFILSGCGSTTTNFSHLNQCRNIHLHSFNRR